MCYYMALRNKYIGFEVTYTLYTLGLGLVHILQVTHLKSSTVGLQGSPMVTWRGRLKFFTRPANKSSSLSTRIWAPSVLSDFLSLLGHKHPHQTQCDLIVHSFLEPCALRQRFLFSSCSRLEQASVLRFYTKRSKRRVTRQGWTLQHMREAVAGLQYTYQAK